MYQTERPALISHTLLFCGAVFGFILLWLYPQMNHGIFIADTGYHIYEAQQSFHAFGHPSKLMWLTSYIGGAWLSLCPTDAVFYWYALGGAILCATSYVAAGLIIREIFPIPLPRLFLILAVSSVFQIHFLYDFAVQYYLLPFCVAEIAFLLYLKSRNRKEHQTLYLICSALTFSVLPALRVPTICFIAAPVLYELCLAFSSKSVRWRPICIYSLTCILGLALVYFLYGLWHAGFEEYQFGCVSSLERSHSIDHILLLSLKGAYHSFKQAIPLIGIICLMRLCAKSKYRLEWLILIPVLWYSLDSIRYYYFCHEQLTLHSAFRALIRFQQTLSFVLLSLILLPSRWGINAEDFRKLGGQHYDEFKLSLLMLTSFGILYPIGSDCFIIKTLYSLPLLLPILLIIIRDYFRVNPWAYRSVMLSLPVIAFAILPGNVDTHAKSTYNRFHMTAPYQTGTLAGMYETPEKVETQEKLIHAIRHYTKPHDEVIFLSLLYELLPAAEIRSWMYTTYHLPLAQDENIDIFIKNKPMPKVAILVKGEHDARWDEDWEKRLRSLRYQKVYTTDCAMALCGEDDVTDSEFSIWVRREETR